MLVALDQLRASLHMERTKQASRVLRAKKHLNGETISFDSAVDLDDVPSSSEVAELQLFYIPAASIFGIVNYIQPLHTGRSAPYSPHSSLTLST